MEKLRNSKGQFVRASEVQVKPGKPLPYLEAALLLFAVLGSLVLLNEWGYIKLF